jgi:hypothetical protein
VIQDLEGKMSQRLLGPLDQLPGVGLGEGNTQILSGRLPERLGTRVEDLAVVCVAGKSIQVADETGKIFVCDVWFKSELVLEGDSECEDEVHGSTISMVSQVSYFQMMFEMQLREKVVTYTLRRRSTFPSSPSRSPVLTQIVRARLREVWMS